MRIGVVGLNFYPERVGIGVYTHDMCRFFVEAGHTVWAVTGFPFYPELRPQAASYTGRWFLTERLHGITVHRCYARVPRRWNVRGRIALELSFAVSALARLATLRRPDVLVVVSPPFAPAVLACVTARARRVPVATHIQDLQPDAAAELGMLRNHPLLRALYAAERLLYSSSTVVTALDETMQARIVEKGVPAEMVEVFPNWVDVELGERRNSANAFRAQHHFGDLFLVVYSGSMGVKQGLDLIVKVAALAVEDPSVRFVLIGDGPARMDLEREAREHSLLNITFLPLQPLERFHEVIAASDISLIPQRPEVRDLVMPSKVLRLMAGGCPVVAAAHADSSLARVLRQSGAGQVVTRHDPAAVWSAIRLLKASPEERSAMGTQGRRYVEEHFGRSAVLGRYLGLLEETARGGVARSPR